MSYVLWIFVHLFSDILYSDIEELTSSFILFIYFTLLIVNTKYLVNIL